MTGDEPSPPRCTAPRGEMNHLRLPALSWLRTRDGLWDAVATAIDAVSSEECENYFTAAGYEPE